MRYLLLLLCLLHAELASAVSDVCFEVSWQANAGVGPSAMQIPGPQKFITVNGRSTVDFLHTALRKTEYDANGKPVWSVSRGCARPQDFNLGLNRIDFRFYLDQNVTISEGWLMVWVNIFLPNGTSPLIGTATYQAHPTVRSWSMVRSLETDLASLAPELAAQAEQRRNEILGLANQAQGEELSFAQNDLDYEAALNGVRGKNFFEISLDSLVRFQEASERYNFQKKGIDLKRSELLQKTEDLKQATAEAKSQLEATARAQGFDLRGEDLLAIDGALPSLEPFASLVGTEDLGTYPYQEWADQAVSAMKADLELGSRQQLILRALQWQERVDGLLRLIQARSDLSKAELNAFESSVHHVNEYIFGSLEQNRPGIITRDLWFTDLQLEPSVTTAIDGDFANQRPEAAKRLKAAINQLSSVEGLVMHIKAAATIAEMYKAAQNEEELAFLDKLMLGATAFIEAAPSAAACLSKNWAAGSYADFYELYYELDFCSGQANDEVDRSIAAASLLIEAGSIFAGGPLGAWAVDKLTGGVKFLKRMVDAAHTAMSVRSAQRIERLAKLAEEAFEQKLLNKADDFRALAKGMPEISPELSEKILRGAPKPRNKKQIIGVHSPSIINSELFQVEKIVSNPDGTISCQVRKALENGNWSVPKETVLFPQKWSDEKIINAGRIVAGSKTIARRTDNGIVSELQRVNIDGVEVIVMRTGDKITSVYPTGGSGILPDKFELL